MSNFLEHLKQVIPEENIRLNEPMKNHTTFRIGGNADFFVSVNEFSKIRITFVFLASGEIIFFI